MKRYVALGSSMASGPGIRPRAAGAPWSSGRSARNYPHLIAERLGLDLVDVTFSGATTAQRSRIASAAHHRKSMRWMARRPW
jgi:hypothetical protein